MKLKLFLKLYVSEFAVIIYNTSVCTNTIKHFMNKTVILRTSDLFKSVVTKIPSPRNASKQKRKTN